MGKTYQISEEDLIEVLQKVVLQKQKSGELKKAMEEFKERSEQAVKRPIGVKLPIAGEYKITARSLRYKLPADIADASGNILYKAGMEVSPLRIKTLSKSLCFFDGDNKKQVDWVNRVCAENKLNKLIMTSGDYLEISNKYQKKYYFDQRGVLVGRLGIEALPAVVRQQGDLLYVEEFPIN
jgi:conjugal transfer pilus assembly protein TraW